MPTPTVARTILSLGPSFPLFVADIRPPTSPSDQPTSPAPPKGGANNGTAFVLFEDDEEQGMQHVTTCLQTVSTSYEDSAITKACKTYYSEAQIHFQLVRTTPSGTLINPAFDYSTSNICCSIYNRIFVPVDRTMSRNFFEHGVRVRKYFQEPALTLARPIYSKATFILGAHASLDVMDRKTFLHVGYWDTGECGVEDGVFEARGDWREYELDTWTRRIDNNSRGLHISSFTLLSVEPDAPWTFISTRPQTPAPKSPSTMAHNPSRASSSTKMYPQNIFTDINDRLCHNSLHQSYLPSQFADLGIFLSHVPEDAGHSATSRPEQFPTLLLPVLLHTNLHTRHTLPYFNLNVTTSFTPQRPLAWLYIRLYTRHSFFAYGNHTQYPRARCPRPYSMESDRARRSSQHRRTVSKAAFELKGNYRCCLALLCRIVWENCTVSSMIGLTKNVVRRYVSALVGDTKMIPVGGGSSGLIFGDDADA
ncbi:hypothetical protein C0995_012861 [Termitomyces sp. Mi166|nr:hypothetical protein C0995_012861 [Termitomyces sp. Mi166\